MSRGGPRRHFTLTLEPDLAAEVANFSTSNGFTSESQAVNHLVRMAVAASPEQGALSADRARAFNEVRIWTMTRVAQALREIAMLLDTSIREAARRDL